jgi:prevent-host-death family protein
MNWQLQDAKNRLSEVVNLALSEGPQTITRHGHPTVVVVDFQEFTRQSGRENLSTILQECPVRDWSVVRDKDSGRTLRFS